MALAILQKLRDRDRAKRTIAPARRIAGRKMTPDLAKQILELHATTEMTQQEIAFKLGVNQGRVNEVIKRGKWLHDDPAAPEAVARDRAKARMPGTVDTPRRAKRGDAVSAPQGRKRRQSGGDRQPELAFGND
jgi:hypothetical protein